MNNNLKTKLQKFFDMELNASIEYILCGCIAKDNLGNMVSKYISMRMTGQHLMIRSLMQAG